MRREPSTDVPVIWTSKGNLPIADCEQYVQWIVTDESITFVLSVKHRGEEVKREVHIYMKHGLSTQAEQASFDGASNE